MLQTADNFPTVCNISALKTDIKKLLFSPNNNNNSNNSNFFNDISNVTINNNSPISFSQTNNDNKDSNDYDTNKNDNAVSNNELDILLLFILQG